MGAHRRQDPPVELEQRADVRLLAVAVARASQDGVTLVAAQAQTVKYTSALSIDPPHIASDKTIKHDYDIVYLRAPRRDSSRLTLRIQPGRAWITLRPASLSELSMT